MKPFAEVTKTKQYAADGEVKYSVNALYWNLTSSQADVLEDALLKFKRNLEVR